MRNSPCSCAAAPSRSSERLSNRDKDLYLPDLERIVGRGWLHPGSVVVADNVKFPGVPGYRDHMTAHEGEDWRTMEHETHVEYQSLIKDLVLESEYLGTA